MQLSSITPKILRGKILRELINILLFEGKLQGKALMKELVTNSRQTKSRARELPRVHETTKNEPIHNG